MSQQGISPPCEILNKPHTIGAFLNMTYQTFGVSKWESQTISSICSVNWEGSKVNANRHLSEAFVLTCGKISRFLYEETMVWF